MYTVTAIEDVAQMDLAFIGKVWTNPLTAVAEMRNRTGHEGTTRSLNGVGHGPVAAAVLERGELLRFGRFTIGPAVMG